MKQRAALTVSIALAVALSAGTAALAPAAQAVEPTDGHEATRTALLALVDKGGLPGAAATVRDDHGSWFGRAGHADTGTGRKRTVGEHFRGASITKTFVATVLLQLEAEGRLDLDDTVERWLPGLVHGNGYDGNTVMLRQLLNHTSGIANYTDDPDFSHDTAGPGFPEHRYDTYQPEKLVAIALKHPPQPGPQREPSYSNTNFVVAGMVIEKATGRSYAHEITRRIIRPLKLRGTSFPGTAPEMPKPHPVGYSRLHQDTPDAEIHDATEQNMTWLGAAGDVISTSGDLNRFQRALVKGDLLPPRQTKEMFEEVPAGHGIGYGLGVEFAQLSCGVKVVGKSGRTNGSLSAMVGTQDGEHQLTFNINGDWLPDSSLYVDVIEAEFCGKVPSRTDRTPAAPRLG
ncbi:D-alanyl-D-alanine carboxypeptidase [Streptomyces sp. Ag82_O1-12]|uniref:serine hydrolase domain-containing protein n=1 Tax=unclassified Streptomyces TaxID=2593676 RepID=UPI000BCAF9BF|nr:MULTISPECIES: serine hydrolase domain-containing protein [unclassified Streptomyces]SMQ14133.1 D-alanyl-D-alanine carboxypeptidase [Streptomyces sp. Ag82_O1-12]SOD43161.1 D-alanyl-D-alanine carboxypeptidase [Streptomyces sp. Ag82_G6-1]